MIYDKRVVSFSIVKNEEDIIEFFIRKNLMYIDKMYILDNMSSDATVDIIKALKDEGLPIFLSIDNSIDYLQSDKVSAAFQTIYFADDFEYFVPLDADEIIVKQSNFDDERLEDGFVYEVERENYLLNFSEEFQGIENISYRFKNPITSKVMIKRPEKDIHSYKISFGNHSVKYKGKYLESLPCNIKIAHVPFRSLDQFCSKHLNGWMAMMYTFSDKQRFESKLGHHWKHAYNYITEYKCNLEYSNVLYYLYNTNTIERLTDKIIFDPLLGDVTLKYKSLQYNNLTDSLVKNFENLLSLYWRIKLNRLAEYGYTDVAIGKCAYASSNYKAGDANFAPEKAISQDMVSKYAFHTRKDNNPWWKLDLLNQFSPDYIIIYNRRDGCQERAKTISVEISVDDRDYVEIHSGISFFGFDDDPLKISLRRSFEFRYLKISLKEKEFLHLAKVCVYIKNATSMFRLEEE